MRIFRKSFCGSATVEASLVFPAIVICIALIFVCSGKMVKKSDEYIECAAKELKQIKEPVFAAESALRVKWNGSVLKDCL